MAVGDEERVRVPEPHPPTPAELLTEQFYAWEQRGRGWQVWPYTVELEPPFRPFLFHAMTQLGAPRDDAHKPTVLSMLAEQLRSLITREPPSPPDVAPETLDWTSEPDQGVFEPSGGIVEFQVTVPPDLKVAREAAERLLLNLPLLSAPVSFEVLGRNDSILMQFACRAPDATAVRQQLQAHFPEAVASEAVDGLHEIWDSSEICESIVVDYGLSKEFMIPLRTARGFDVDPLIGIAAALEELGENEAGLLQVLFQPARHPWAESILRSVHDGAGRSFFSDAPALAGLAKIKVSSLLYAAQVRIAAQSPVPDRAWQIVRTLGGVLNQFGSPERNQLIPLSNDEYSDGDHEADLLDRVTRRCGMLLNSEELVSFVHLPSASVRSPKLLREDRKTKASPELTAGHATVLGENVHAGRTVEVSLSSLQRLQHTYVIGASGTGKSTLLLNLILQDLHNGDGVAVLDPHGDLIDEVLGRLPEGRAEDLVLLDPSDADWPVGFNILSAHSEIEKTLMASDMVAVFRRLSTSWGDQMTSVLSNAILAVLESSRGGTLADLRRFLVEKEFRREFLATVEDPEIRYYWQREYPLISGRSLGPLLTRLDTFLRPKLVRNMVSQRENRLDLATIMNERKILLAKLAQGAIGEENAYLLGTLLVSKLQQLAMARQEIEASARRPFYVYVDEFHNFVTPSMAAILSAARKYRLGLTLAHQDLRQLSRNDDILGAVIGNPYTRICFRIGDLDARKLEDGFSHFNGKDMQSLGTGEAICRVERAEYDFNLKTRPVPRIDADALKARINRLVARSREKYGTSRRRVEEELRKATATPTEPAKPEEESQVGQPQRPPATSRARVESRTPPATHSGARSEPDGTPRRVSPQPIPGRGGRQHKYLQEIIRRSGNQFGWRAVIEEQVLDGQGHVDVALYKGERSIAFEISVSSTPEQELKNVDKCLAAGFENVVIVSSDRKSLAEVRGFLSEALAEYTLARVSFLTPEEVYQFLGEQEAASAATEETVRGYRVKRRYRPSSMNQRKDRTKAIADVVLRGLKKFKKGDKENK